MYSLRHALRFVCMLLALVIVTSTTGGIREARAQTQETGDPVVYQDPQRAPYERLLAASQIPATVEFQVGGFPNMIFGMFPTSGANQVERAEEFVNEYRDLFLQNHPDLALYVRTTIGMTETGEETVVFEQTYRGVIVEGAQLAVTILGDSVYMASGNLLTSRMIADDDIDVRPSLSFTDTRSSAREALGDPDAAIPFSPELRIFDPALNDTEASSQPRLVWKVMTQNTELLVDARTGEIARLIEREADETDFDLDLEHAHGTSHYDTGCYWWTSADEEVGDEDGVYDDWQDDTEITTAWEASHFAYNFYFDNFGLESYDDSDGDLEVYVYSQWTDGSSTVNARWKAGFGCDLIEFRPGKVAFDRLTHEYTHAVISYRDVGLLQATYTSRVLNEGFAYIMAAFSDGNWTIGENTVDGSGASWNLANPTTNNAPDRWSQYNTALTEHANSMILGRAANLVTDGGTFNGYTVTGIGRSKAMGLFYQVTRHATEGTNMPWVRHYAVGTALVFANPPQVINNGNPLYGFTAQDVCAVRNAFAAVELGRGDMNCDGIEEPNVNDPDEDGVWSSADNCPNDWNPIQDDWDGDGIGNICDPLEGIDADRDGVPEACYGDVCGLPDNCPGLYNPSQTDENFNGIGKACDITEDGDFDDDGVPNVEDNCFLDYNPDQINSDPQNDNLGDACDPDEDGDGWSNDDDNCIANYNPDQMNSDNDPLGDVCDICPTGDNMTGVAEGSLDINPYDDDPGDVVIYYDEETYTCNEGVTRPDLQGFPIFDTGGVFTSDCVPYDVTIFPKPGGYETLPIQMNNDGLDWFPRGAFMTVTLDGLPENVQTWIQDSDGRSFGSSHTAETRTMRVRPLGGQQYAIGMAFHPDMTADEPITFNGRIGLEFGGVPLCPPVSRPTIDLGEAIPVTPVLPMPTPTVQPTLPPPPAPTATPDMCSGFMLTSPSGGMVNGPMTFYWNPVVTATHYRISIFDQAGGSLLFMGDSPAPNTNAEINVSREMIGGSQNLVVQIDAFAGDTRLCYHTSYQHRESPPDAPPPAAPCVITITGATLVYTVPVVDSGNIFDQVQPGHQMTAVGRLADNSWWKTDYWNSWIQTSAVGSAATTSGGCDSLPVIAP